MRESEKEFYMKKKLLLLTVLVFALTCLFAITVSAAETITVDGLTYYCNNSNAELTNANQSCALETVIVPQTVTSEGGTTYTVNRVNQNAFQNNTTIKYVSLPPTVTYIGPAAFHSCTSLQFVDFNDNQNDVDFNNWGTFMGCTSLKAISLPDKTDYITNRMFSGCTNLKAVYLPSATKNIETNGYGNQTSFYECKNLYFVNQQFEVRDENGDFYGDSFEMPAKPEVYYFPSKLEKIFDRDAGIGFASCFNLNPILVFPETLTRFWINDGVFYECGKNGASFTVVFLGNMTDVRIGMRENRAKGVSYIFANPADVDLSSVNVIDSSPAYTPNLNGNEFIYFCKSGKGFNLYNLGGGSDATQYTNDNTTLEVQDKHLFKIEKNTAPTCTVDGVKGYVCFCGAASTESDVIKAPGHTASDIIKNKFFTKNEDGSYNYFANMIKVCDCTACDATDVEFDYEGTALFATDKGYSFSETDASSFSYTLHVNVNAIKAYLAENAGFKYGVVVSADTANNPISIVDGAVNKNVAQTIIVELQGSTNVYEYVMTKLTFDADNQGKSLICQAYAVDGADNKVSYLGPDKATINAEVISHAILVEKYESEEDLEQVA